MRRSKSAYMNYVCGGCFHKLYECTCEFFPPQTLLHVDEAIQEPVRVLNSKGYITIGCCEGHYAGESGATTHVILNMRYPEIADRAMPVGFKYIGRKNMLVYSYAGSTKKNAFELEKRIALKRLLDWCNELPVEPHSFKRK